MAKILTIDDCFINNKIDEEQRLILESSLDSIKDDVKTTNLDNYEEERFNERCMHYINEMKNVYLKLSNLGDNEEEKINIFKTCLIEKNKFYQINRDKIEPYPKRGVHYSNAEVEFYMTKEHKAKYLEILTEELKGYYYRIKNNCLKNRAYMANGKPTLELTKARELAREAFNKSYKDTENSYKSRLDEYNKKEDLKRSKEKVMRRTNMEFIPDVGPKLEKVLPKEGDLKELLNYIQENNKGI